MLVDSGTDPRELERQQQAAKAAERPPPLLMPSQWARHGQCYLEAPPVLG
jgi:hypothetical protein